MSDQLHAYDPMAQTERRLGLRPIEELLAERAARTERIADLRARFGAFGTYNDLRKVELSRIAGLVRAQALRDKVKMTAAEVDDGAHSHPDYRDFITEATRQRAEWVKLESEIEAIDWTIRRGQTVASFLTSEARL